MLGGNHGRPLYRIGSDRCWCGLGLFCNLTNGHATHSQKECVNHPQGCESSTKYNASDPASRYLLCACRRKSPTEYVARRRQVRGRVTGGWMFRSEDGTTT